jgi:DNA-binding CsgD family transcriptional regulator
MVRWDRILAVRVMLMLSDREEISRGLAEGLQYKEIASGWGVIRR